MQPLLGAPAHQLEPAQQLNTATADQWCTAVLRTRHVGASDDLDRPHSFRASEVNGPPVGRGARDRGTHHGAAAHGQLAVNCQGRRVLRDQVAGPGTPAPGIAARPASHQLVTCSTAEGRASRLEMDPALKGQGCALPTCALSGLGRGQLSICLPRQPTEANSGTPADAAAQENRCSPVARPSSAAP
jgi:hypothetical protein